MSTKKNSDNDMLGREMGSLKKRVTDLEASEQRLRATLYGIGEGIIVTDAGGCLLQMNPVAEALTGCSEAEARAHPVDEVFRTINEQTRDSSESPVTRVLREGTVVGLANHSLLVARDGTERPVAGSIAPIRKSKRLLQAWCWFSAIIPKRVVLKIAKLTSSRCCWPSATSTNSSPQRPIRSG